MVDRYDRLFVQLEDLIPGLSDLKPGDHRKSRSGGFMDLNLDVLTRTPKELRIALSHYYKHPSGDMIADPDMEIRVYLIPDWRKAEALTFQDARRYDEVYPTPETVIPALKRSLNDFLAQWLTNLKNQGHKLNPETIDDHVWERCEICSRRTNPNEIELYKGICADCADKTSE